MANLTAWADVPGTVQYNVHIGTWINWSRGSILGATLTINRQYGSLLTAFTAFFVGIVASSFWRIICIVFHRSYSTLLPRDALHHQRQVVLRNSPSAVSGLWATTQLAWTWHHRAKASASRTLPTIICAALSVCAFTAASGFSSWISSGIGDEVLLDGSNCGIVNANALSIDSISVISPYISQMTNGAANYAQQCYSANTTGLFECTSLVKNRLEATMDDQAPCPFDDHVCRDSNSNLRLDTGFIDSGRDLGLNTPDEQRVLLRQVLHCAPLDSTEFVSNVSTGYDNYTRYWYGPSITTTSNFTYEVEDLNAQYLRQKDNNLINWGLQFRLTVLYSSTANNSVWADEASQFIPIPELFRPDADLFLIFLSGNGIYFLEETNDPWYRAGVPGTELSYSQGPDENRNRTAYQPQDAASPMGCIQQYQYCNGDGQCGSLASFADAVASALPLFNGTIEEIWDGTAPIGATALRFIWVENIIASALDLGALITSLGGFSLESHQSLDQGLMGPIPDNQWQLDVIHWWGTLLAMNQAAFVNAANGPSDASLMPYTTRPDNPYSKMLCNNQKILSTDFSSFSLFGLYFTYITGVVIVFLSYTLGPLFSYLDRTRGYKHHPFLEWSTNEILQLQRIAYQGLGCGSWSGYTDAIPITEPAEVLEDLALAYSTQQSKDEEKRGDAEEGKQIDVTDTSDAVVIQDDAVGDRSETATIRTCTPSGSVGCSEASVTREDSILDQEHDSPIFEIFDDSQRQQSAGSRGSLTTMPEEDHCRGSQQV